VDAPFIVHITASSLFPKLVQSFQKNAFLFMCKTRQLNVALLEVVQPRSGLIAADCLWSSMLQLLNLSIKCDWILELFKYGKPGPYPQHFQASRGGKGRGSKLRTRIPGTVFTTLHFLRTL